MARDCSCTCGWAAVVEDGDGAVLVAPSVVLEGGPGVIAHLEVALFTAEAPQDPAALAVDLGDGPGVAGRDEQVAVVVDVYGVDVEVVVAVGGVFGRQDVRLIDSDVLQAVPLEEYFAGLDINLLEYPFPRRAVLPAACGG
jgi:hypothetical protein